MRPDERSSSPYRLGSVVGAALGVGVAVDDGTAIGVAVGTAEVRATVGDGDGAIAVVHETSNVSPTSGAIRRSVTTTA